MANSEPLSKAEIEQGTRFAPKFDSNGLMACVVLDVDTKQVLVIAFVNEESLALTRSTKKVHFWSRSRQKLWMKGETSGHVLHVEEIRVDCDQDALVIYARPAGPTCHTGVQSCFYRVLDPEVDDSHALVKVKT